MSKSYVVKSLNSVKEFRYVNYADKIESCLIEFTLVCRSLRNYTITVSGFTEIS